MSSHPRPRISHALNPEQQAEYLTWARALRLSKFRSWEPSEATPEAHPPSHPNNNIPEPNFQGTSTAHPNRKPAFRKVLQGQITKFYQRVLKPIRDRFERRGLDLDPERQALWELRKEIEREEKRLRGRDKERRERELRTAGRVARAVREELRRRDTHGEA